MAIGGRKPRSDSKERARQVLFRMSDSYKFFDQRTRDVPASTVARRDLRRYWTTVNQVLRQSEIDPADLERVARDLMENEAFMKMDVGMVIASYIKQTAQDINAPSMLELSVAEAVAVADLLGRVKTPSEAADLLKEIQIR